MTLKIKHYLSLPRNPCEPWLQLQLRQLASKNVRRVAVWIQSSVFFLNNFYKHRRLIHSQPALLPCLGTRSGASLTSLAANRVAPFGDERRDFTVARKLRAILHHLTGRTSALFVRNGAKRDDWIHAQPSVNSVNMERRNPQRTHELGFIAHTNL